MSVPQAFGGSPRPLVSIGVPVYNGEGFLRPALDALLAQRYDHLEIIISDNASTDRTQEICLAYAARDPRITYHRNSANIGVYANFQRVFALASGPYFMWAAVDDTRPPAAVQQCLEALERDEQAVLAHGVVLVRTAAGSEAVRYPNDAHPADRSPAGRVRAFVEGRLHNGILYGLYRREALRRVVLGSCLGQDYLLTLQMCLVGPFAHTGAPIGTFSERKMVASVSPMYTELPLTLGNLIRAGRMHRRKCWTVLFMGIYYLARVGDVGWSDRWRSVATYAITFARVYRSRLATEVVFQLSEPIAWLGAGLWRLARRSGMLGRFTRKVQI
jgi:glycosyltransferase involved in cell wall biosynthesis